MVKVNKEIKIFPVNKYSPITLSVMECNDFDEANKVLKTEYNKMKHLLSDADRERLDIILK